MESNFDPSPAYNELNQLPPSSSQITSQPKVQHLNQHYGQPQQQLQPRQVHVMNFSNQSGDHHNNRHKDECDDICCCCCILCIKCITWT